MSLKGVNTHFASLSRSVTRQEVAFKKKRCQELLGQHVRGKRAENILRERNSKTAVEELIKINKVSARRLKSCGYTQE